MATAAKRSPSKLKSVKAYGRSLSDFKPLLPAEMKLLEACRLGEIAIVNNTQRPKEKSDDVLVRASFIRFLVLGGDDQVPVHEEGVSLSGAWIEGDLILSYCNCVASLYLEQCKIDGEFHAVDAKIPGLFFSSSVINSLNADRLITAGALHLHQSRIEPGKVRLLGAKIGGSFSCTGGTFKPKKGFAISCDGAEIVGDINLDNGFNAHGLVRMINAKVGSNLACVGGKINSDDGQALVCDGVGISGNVLLAEGFQATGTVHFIGAIIAGDLVCSGGEFEVKEGDALNCERARIGSGLFFRNIGSLKGAISFSEAEVSSIFDDQSSWAMARYVDQDGFRYARIGLGPVDATSRISWLMMQPKEHLGKDFKPQPWEQLIKVLREMGHDTDARAVAIEKQRMLRVAGKITGIAYPLHRLYGLLAGYGYKPLNAVCAMFLVWAFSSHIFDYAEQRGLMGPVSPAIQANKFISDACSSASGTRETNWTRCKDLPQEYTTFDSYLYSLDLILPPVDLQQDSDWAPIVVKDDGVTRIGLGLIFRSVMWFEILFGWAMTLLIVAVVGNLVKKD
jgi:hypothetical protein